MPQNSTYYLDQEQADYYKGAGYTTEYAHRSGTFPLPLALPPGSTDPPVVFPQAHAPYRIRKDVFDLTKGINPPVIPKPVSTGAFTFVSGNVIVATPMVDMNGAYTWKVGGEMIWVSSVYNSPEDGYIVGGLPFALPSQAQDVLQGGNGLPLDVAQAGCGPQTGYTNGLLVDLTDPNYSYSEPSYFPGVFLSEDMVNGFTSVPTFQ